MAKKIKDKCSGCGNKTYLNMFSKLCSKCEKEVALYLKQQEELKNKKKK